MIQDAGWAGGQHLMVRPISNDLRKRAVAAVAKGESAVRWQRGSTICGFPFGKLQMLQIMAEPVLFLDQQLGDAHSMVRR